MALVRAESMGGRMMALLEPNDILFAHKALNIAPDLSAAARRVAGAIIDHFNKRTGQCDPSVERLARLTGLHEVTVKKATAEICAAGLFEKRSHGGKMHRAQYQPQWAKFQEIVAEWDAAMKEGAPAQRSQTATLEAAQGSQTAPFEGSQTATQTLRSNPSNKPVEGNLGEKPVENVPVPAVLARQKRAGRKEGFARNQLNLLLPISGTGSAAAARAGAEKRIMSGLMALGDAAFSDAVDAISGEMHEAAVAAEMRRRGAGQASLAEALGMDKLRRQA
jgi:DNA-binding transcriptional regulator YhcF (GntR family)